MSFRERAHARQEVVPPPPPNPADLDVPRVAERVPLDGRYRQPVQLEAPEMDASADGVMVRPGQSPARQRSPLEAFPQPRDIETDLGNKSGHTPPFDDEQTEDADSEELPDVGDSSRLRPTVDDSESLPVLRDGDESDLTFPGVHKQTSASRIGKVTRVEPLAPKLSVENFHLTRDARPDSETQIIQARSLKRGQNLVVRTELVGLKHVQRGGQSLTKVNFHFEMRNATGQILFATSKATSTDPVATEDSPSLLLRWLAIPTSLKPGKYTLQLHLQDGFSRQTALVEMPVEVR